MNIKDMTVIVRAELSRGRFADVQITGNTLAALRSCGTSRQGAQPRGGFGNEAMAELRRLGLIGPNGGLTRRGSYAYLDSGEQIEAELGW